MLDYSSFYDPDQGYDSIISDETTKLISQYINIGETILDIGCGTGRISKHFNDNDIHLVDISLKYLNEAKKNIPSAKIYHNKFLDIEFEHCFDNIFAFNNIQEQEELEKFFSKAVSLLNKNGMLFVSYPNANSLHRIVGILNKHLKSIEEISNKSKNLGTVQMISSEIIENLSVKFNLEIVLKKGFCLKPYTNEIMEKLDIELLNKLNNSKIMMENYSAMTLSIFKKIS